jgi:hypothetical protein
MALPPKNWAQGYDKGNYSKRASLHGFGEGHLYTRNGSNHSQR